MRQSYANDPISLFYHALAAAVVLVVVGAGGLDSVDCPLEWLVNQQAVHCLLLIGAAR